MDFYIDRHIKKCLLWGTLIAIAILICITTIVLLSKTDFLLWAGRLAMMLGVLLVLNLIFLLVDKFKESSRFKKLVRIIACLFPVSILFLFTFDIKWLAINSDFVYVAAVILDFVFMIFAIIYIFLINEIKSITGIILIILYIILSLILLRLNIGDPEPHVVTSFIMLGSGMYLFGLRSLFIIEKNKYLKVVVFITCFLILAGSFELIMLSPTYADIALIVYSITVFLITLVVLFSLPGSGYIKWNSLHKKILNKIIIPWIFLILIISVRFIFPELNMLFFREKHDQYQEFGLDGDYQIINKNGLEPE